MATKREQNDKEEVINAAIHGAGIVLCLIGIGFLVYNTLQKPTLNAFWAALAFGVGMLGVYTCSTLYHAAKDPKRKHILKIADHISIYFLIAGTYTPLMISYLPEADARLLLTILWSLVGLGVFFKLFFINKFEILSVIVYLAMGWMALFVIKPLFEAMPSNVFMCVIAGAILYSAGVYFYVKSYKLYYHSVWHVFVLGGTITHFSAVYLSV